MMSTLFKKEHKKRSWSALLVGVVRRRKPSLVVVCLACLALLLMDATWPSMPASSSPSMDKRRSHIYPVDLKDCVSMRFRNSSLTMSIPEAAQYLLQHPRKQTTLKVGLTILEDNSIFWSLNDKGTMHFYHYLEFLLWGFKEIMELTQQLTSTQQRPVKVDLQWVHAPYLLRKELEGSRGTNRLITALVLHKSSDPNSAQVKGMEDNDEYTRAIHPSFSGHMGPAHPHAFFSKILPSRAKRRIKQIPNAAVRQQNWRQMADAVDAVLFIDRFKCDHQEAYQMIAKLSDDGEFPLMLWNQDVSKGLEQGMTESSSNTRKDDPDVSLSLLNTKEEDSGKFVTCYIDRQNTPRRMPPHEHSWLVGLLTQHPRVHFKQLHMEKFSAYTQIKIARTCNLLIGVHGNGLSHQVWMKPNGYVVEYFWGVDGFVFFYSILARMMRHQYLGFWNGRKLDVDRVLRKEYSVTKDLKPDSPIDSPRGAFTTFLNKVLADFQQKQKEKSMH